MNGDLIIIDNNQKMSILEWPCLELSPGVLASVCLTVALPAGGFTWECPPVLGTPQGPQRRWCCPRWRSGSAGWSGLESRRSESLGRKRGQVSTQQGRCDVCVCVGPRTLVAVVVRTLVRGAAPLWAATAGAAWSLLAWRRHLLPWRRRQKALSVTLCYDTSCPTLHRHTTNSKRLTATHNSHTHTHKAWTKHIHHIFVVKLTYTSP